MDCRIQVIPSLCRKAGAWSTWRDGGRCGLAFVQSEVRIPLVTHGRTERHCHSSVEWIFFAKAPSFPESVVPRCALVSSRNTKLEARLQSPARRGLTSCCGIELLQSPVSSLEMIPRLFRVQFVAFCDNVFVVTQGMNGTLLSRLQTEPTQTGDAVW